VGQDAVFRKVSLDRLASPEQLDQLMRVTDARGWIALLAIVIMLLTAAAWGIVGSIPQNVSGVGILIKSGGVFDVAPVAGGRVLDVAVSVGDLVTEGQVVARIEQTELRGHLQELKATLASLREQHTQTLTHGSRDLALQITYLGSQRTALQESIASSERSLTWYAEKIAAQERLVDEGLLIKQTLLTSRQQEDAERAKINDAHSQLAQIEAKQAELEIKQQEEIAASQTKIDDQDRAISESERDLKAKTEVVAPHTGRILEIMTEQGAVVSKGEPILSLDLTGRAVKDLEAVLYVPSLHGKQIRAGMPIFISPSTVKQEEYGLMLGKVTYVSDFPATSKGMQRVLKNDKLVVALAGQDAPYEIHADLIVDPETPSHYRWSSSSGPPLRIQSGTMATGNITIEAKRPIEMVIPWVRQNLGV
jgi:HlyD family secretion protein